MNVKNRGMRIKRIGWLLAVAPLLALCEPALAVTECTGHATRVWTGDSGAVWVFMDSGLAWYVQATDSNTKNILASATTALVTGLTVTVRFQADSVPCNASSGDRSDVIGMYLNGS